MISRRHSSVLACLLALFFGVAQLVCACMSTGQMPHEGMMSHGETSMHMDVAEHHEASGGHDLSSSSQHYGNRGEDHTEGCTHCDGYSAVTTGYDSAMGNAAETFTPEKTILPTQPSPKIARASLFPSALSALRWLHPPEQTPVSLKTRIQT